MGQRMGCGVLSLSMSLPAGWRTLPPSPALWSPEDLASFVESRGSPAVGGAIRRTVRLHSFDEVDGPRLLRGDGKEKLQELGASAADAEIIVNSLHELAKQPFGRFESAANTPETAADASNKSLRSRLQASLWGVFVGDALAMPVHWYYDTDALDRDYGMISSYVAPLERHSSNGIMNNHWRDNKHNIQGLIQQNIMLHGKANHWATRFTHYHADLRAGENTLNAQCARIVMRSLASRGGMYDSHAFLSAYREFLTTPGSHNDSYAEAFHRQLLHNHFFNKLALAESAGAENHDTPSIGGFVMLPPVVLSAALRGEGGAADTFKEHLFLTHRSERLAAFAQVYADLLRELVHGMNAREAIAKAGARIGLDLPAFLAEPGLNER
eukprot:TRINITY_DN59403_c0_g1_i1.p1 TRINITY_DN59403_c0_g1~~TRINITY_DN59403_c0_g1_i1.p1  ORF type:complete len:392 (-),score=56.13 TRINITY_DN59403_c0_g1_i1:171-1319(-)